MHICSAVAFTGNLNIQNNQPPIDVSEKMSAEEKISLRKMILRMGQTAKRELLQYFVAYALAWSAPTRGSNGITLTLEGENMVRYRLCGTTNWSSSGKRRCSATR